MCLEEAVDVITRKSLILSWNYKKAIFPHPLLPLNKVESPRKVKKDQIEEKKDFDTLDNSTYLKRLISIF